MSAAAYPSSSQGTFTGSQSQFQNTGPVSTAEAVSLQLQHTLSSLTADQLNRIFSRAEELHEEEGSYLAPREVAQQEARTRAAST